MASRFPSPAVVVLPLSDGDTITVRTRLTHGEEWQAFARMYMETQREQGKLIVDPTKVGESVIAAYLVDWTFKDDSGQVVPIRGLPVDEMMSVVNGLDPDTWRELKEAIEKHDVGVLARRTQEKKPPAGATPSA